MRRTWTTIFLAATLFALLLLPACREKPKNPVSEYGDSLINSYKGAQNAAEIANLDALKKAVQAYRAANGSYPAELKDAESLVGGPIDLSNYDYDPATGAVTPKPQK
ncbi:MAG: hypothetical protein ACM3MB_10765 [Acidobacteriota bacterium]